MIGGYKVAETGCDELEQMSAFGWSLIMSVGIRACYSLRGIMTVGSRQPFLSPHGLHGIGRQVTVMPLFHSFGSIRGFLSKKLSPAQ
jgi:hypothetical protein